MRDLLSRCSVFAKLREAAAAAAPVDVMMTKGSQEDEEEESVRGRGEDHVNK